MSGEARICQIGFGEVGQILAEDLISNAGTEVKVFDILFEDPISIPSIAARRQPDVVACGSATDAATGTDLVISAVTASEAIAAARSVAPAVAPGVFYLDLNSVSPETSKRTSEVVEEAGARFVEAAVMSPIGPKRLTSSILLSGPSAEPFLAQARSLGFTGAGVISDQLGAASAAKMARSVLIKGIEALLAESLATARHYGVEEAVLASLNDLLPADDWPAKARYMITRSMQHGERRAEEMREAADTVAAAGIDEWMSRATAERQQWAARFADQADADLDEILDTLRESRNDPNGGPDSG